MTTTTVPRILLADTVTRADVRVSRRYGWVTHAATDSIVGSVWADVNGAGQPIWKAQAGDVGGSAFKRDDAIATVIALHNVQEKARAYDLLVRHLDLGGSATDAAPRCVCARHADGSVTTSPCPVHADTDPCLTMALVTGRRREGTIRRGVCTSCGHGSAT